MTPELIAALLLIGFLAGCLFCWPLAERRGELKAMRNWDLEFDDDEEWWQL